MTATEELRAMLDKRSVEWVCYSYENHTWWNGWHAEERASVNGLFLKVEAVITPAQAIEATLGRGECHMRLRDDIRGHAYQDVYECSECGEQVLRETFMGESEPPNYCPHCGAKAVEQ